MEERHVTTGDGPSEAPQRLMDGIGVFSEIEDYGRRIEVLAEAMSVGIRIADYELPRHAVRSSRRRGTGASGPELGSSRRHPLRSA